MTSDDTCMKAVPIMTPVPKCLTEKNTHDGIRSRLDRLATIGNSAPLLAFLPGRGTKCGT